MIAAVAAWVLSALRDRVGAESAAGAGREQRVVGLTGTFGEPGGEHWSHRRDERHRSLFSAFAVAAANVGAGPERDVAAVQAGEFGDPQSGVDRERQQRAIAAAFPAGRVGRVDQRGSLGRGEVGDRSLLMAFGWDREHSRDRVRVFWMSERREREQRADRGQPQVAGLRHVPARGLEVLEKAGDQLLVEVLPVQRGGRLAGLLVGVVEQQPQRVAVGGDRARAGLQLPGEAVTEERLDRGGDQRHRVTVRVSSSRRAACASSSGAADRYQ